ncbi:hypothetical protein B0H13DRAFT_2141808 [Mycena leptocephala]|nr:hypothetical protein B0H13DRAFT_2141808 [Mycena leptocephala]
MSDMQLEVTPTVQWQLDLFNSLYFIGLIFLTIVILPPIFSRNVLRSPLWFAFMGSWMLYCFSFLLLVGQQLGPEPPFGICLFQAALVHAVPALATIAGVCFVVDIYCTLRISLKHSYWIPMKRTPVLLTLPIVSFIGMFILSLAIGLQDHSTVNREPNNMYCHINTGLPTLVSAILSGWALFVAIGVEIAAAIMLYRNSAVLSLPTLGNPSTPTEPPIARELLTLLGLSLSAMMLFHVHESDIKWNVLVPILPPLAAILFGAQKDIISGWRFWKHETKAAQAEAV